MFLDGTLKYIPAPSCQTLQNRTNLSSFLKKKKNLLKQRALKAIYEEENNNNNNNTLEIPPWNIIFTAILFLYVCESLFHPSSVINQQLWEVKEPGQGVLLIIILQMMKVKTR